MTDPGDAARLVAIALSREPGPAGPVIGIDGRSGSGKTTFAEHVADAVRTATGHRPPVLHLDDLYRGWDGLAPTPGLLAAALASRSGTTLHAPTWDWATSSDGPVVEVETLRGLVVEGVGAGAAAMRLHLDALAWLDLPTDERRRRALARDGATYAPHWERWAAQEDTLLAADAIPAHADLVVRTTGRTRGGQ